MKGTRRTQDEEDEEDPSQQTRDFLGVSDRESRTLATRRGKAMMEEDLGSQTRPKQLPGRGCGFWKTREALRRDDNGTGFNTRLAAKALAVFAKHAALADPASALNEAIHRDWDGEARLVQLVCILLSASMPLGAKLLRQTVSPVAGWIHAAKASLRALLEGGFTNGRCVCLRGLRLGLMNGEEGQCPFCWEESSMEVLAPFLTIDRLLERPAAPAPAATSVGGNVSSQRRMLPFLGILRGSSVLREGADAYVGLRDGPALQGLELGGFEPLRVREDKRANKDPQERQHKSLEETWFVLRELWANDSERGDVSLAVLSVDGKITTEASGIVTAELNTLQVTLEVWTWTGGLMEGESRRQFGTSAADAQDRSRETRVVTSTQTSSPGVPPYADVGMQEQSDPRKKSQRKSLDSSCEGRTAPATSDGRTSGHDPSPEAWRLHTRLLNTDLFGVKPVTEVNALLKGVTSLTGLCPVAVSAYSWRKRGLNRILRTHGTEAASAAAGHEKADTMLYYVSREGLAVDTNLRTTAPFLVQVTALGDAAELCGDVMGTVVPAETYLDRNTGPNDGFFGRLRYSRVPKSMRALATRPQDDAAAFSGFDATQKGWATRMEEAIGKAFPGEDDGSKEKRSRAADILEDLESSVRDVVNRQRVLGRDVKRALDRQMADDARELTKERQRSSAAAGGGRAPTSLVSSARKSIEEAVRGGKESFQRFVGTHFASLVTAASDQEMCRQRRAQDEEGQALLKHLKSKPDLSKRLTLKELKRITQSPWRQHRFTASTNLITRGGRGLVNGSPRESSAAIGGRCGRPTGHAQNQRPPGSARSETGVSAIIRDGTSVTALECIYTECTAVFTGAGKVQHNMEAHLQADTPVSLRADPGGLWFCAWPVGRPHLPPIAALDSRAVGERKEP
eukprot:g4303.t1